MTKLKQLGTVAAAGIAIASMMYFLFGPPVWWTAVKHWF